MSSVIRFVQRRWAESVAFRLGAWCTGILLVIAVASYSYQAAIGVAELLVALAYGYLQALAWFLIRIGRRLRRV